MVDDKLAPSCGLLCVECPFLEKSCRGCGYVQGRPFWTEEFQLSVCPIYNCCVNGKNLEHCGLCPELPCKIFLELKDPDMSEEEFQRSLKERQENLNSRRKKGTEKWIEELKEDL